MNGTLSRSLQAIFFFFFFFCMYFVRLRIVLQEAFVNEPDLLRRRNHLRSGQF